MAKVTLNVPEPVTPPPTTVTLELSMDEAIALSALLNNLPGATTDFSRFTDRIGMVMGNHVDYRNDWLVADGSLRTNSFTRKAAK